MRLKAAQTGSGFCPRRWRAVWLAVLTCLLCLAPAGASDLARLIPDDIGLCFESERLTDISRDLARSPLYERLKAVPRLRQVITDAFEKPRAVGQRLAARMGITERDLGERFISGRASLAIWPDESKDANGLGGTRLLMAFEARDPQRAREVVSVLQQDFAKSKAALRSQTLEHAGRRYFLAEQQQGRQRVEVCLATIDQVVLLSSSKAIMCRALDLAGQPDTAQGSLLHLAAYRDAMGRVQPDAAIRIFVSPRPWDAVVLKRLKQEGAPAEEELFYSVLSEAWQAADYWIFWADMEPYLSVDSYLHFQSEKLSAPLRDVGRSFAGTSTFFERVPSNAALAFAGRMDLARIIKMTIESRPDQKKEIDAFRESARGVFLGLDLFDDILPNLGPDGGFYMTPPVESAGPGQSPVAWVGASQLRPRSEGTPDPDVTLALDGALRMAMQLGENMQNSKTEEATAKVEVDMENGLSVVSLQGLDVLPPEAELCYAFTPDYLLLSTDLGAIKPALRVERSQSLASNPRFVALSRHAQGAGQILYMDCAAVRKALAEHEPFMVQVLRRLRNEPADEVQQKLNAFAQLAQLGETIIIAGKVGEEGIAFSFAVSAETPAATP